MYLILEENKFMNKEKADMIIYTTEDGLTKVETTFDGDTVWLSIDQMAELFQRFNFLNQTLCFFFLYTPLCHTKYLVQ